MCSTWHPELASRFFDVNYDELVSHPLNTIRRLYRQLDLPMTSATHERVGDLAAKRARYGGREYVRVRRQERRIEPAP